MGSTGEPVPDRTATAVLEQLSTAVMLIDRAGRGAYRNHAAVRMFGTGPAPPGLTGAIGDLARRARAEDRPMTAHDLALRTPGGEACHADVTLTPLDEPAGWLMVELRRHDHEREAGEALLSQHGAASMLVRSLGHELRNPLAGLKGAAQLLERELAGSPLADYVNLIDREVLRMASLLDQLGMPVPQRSREPVNIHEVLERVAGLAEGEADGGLEVIRDYDPSLPALKGGFDALVQALVNIARNAWQAGARRLRLRTRLERDAVIAASRHPRVVRVDVEDDGPGIPANLRALVFFPMVTGRRDGSGLGLALAQSIAIRHDGLITFESEPGCTVFTLRLPLDNDGHES